MTLWNDRCVMLTIFSLSILILNDTKETETEDTIEINFKLLEK